MPASTRLTRSDAVLAALAIVGVLAFAWLLPRVHPDTSASFGLTADRAAALADAALLDAGYDLDGLERRAVYSGSSSLMDSLQRALPREELTAALGERPGRLPAFRWRVHYDRVDGRGGLPFPQPAFTVDLGTDGRLWRMENAAGNTPQGPRDRADAARALVGDGGALPVPPAVREDPLAFGLDTAGVALGSGWRQGVAAERERLASGGMQKLGPSAAAVFALGAIGGTGYAGLGMEPVRVDPVPGRPQVARVRLEALEPVWGQQVAADVEVSAMGGVLAVEPRINASADAEPSSTPQPERRTARREGTQASLTVSDDVDLTAAVALASWLALGLAFLVLFLRRLSAQAIDFRAALVDAAVTAAAVAAYPVLLFSFIRRAYPFEGLQFVLAAGLGTLLWVAGAGLMALVASGVSDSLMRARQREKLDALALLRQGRVLNRLVGASLLRGALVSAALLGLLAALWAALPIRATYEGDGWSAYQYALSPGVVVVTQAFWFQLVSGLAVFVGLGAVLMGAFRRRVPATGPGRAALVAGGLGVATALLALAPGWVGPGPAWAVWAYGGVYGAALGLVLWRYDALATLVAYVLVEAVWRMGPVLWVEAAPFFPDAVGVIGLVALVGLVGVVGVRRAPSRTELRRYVPAYITELAERERLQREVEIAREVQRSFLPTTMPDVAGLDLAAVCIPAEEVGGDYYDAFAIPGADGGPPRLAVVVGDVSGKGIQAAFYMTLVKGILRTVAPTGLGPAAVLTRVNEVFVENARPGAFVSAIYGVIDPDARTFTYARAGHNPLLVRRSANGQAGRGERADVEARRPAGLAVGLTAGHAFAQTLREDTVHLQPGDALVLYTDGFSEAMDAGRELFTDARLARLFAEADEKGAAALVGHAVADVRAFASADANPDDMTMLVARLAEED